MTALFASPNRHRLLFYIKSKWKKKELTHLLWFFKLCKLIAYLFVVCERQICQNCAHCCILPKQACSFHFSCALVISLWARTVHSFSSKPKRPKKSKQVTLTTYCWDTESSSQNGWTATPMMGRPVDFWKAPMRTATHFKPPLVTPSSSSCPTWPRMYCAVESAQSTNHL